MLKSGHQKKVLAKNPEFNCFSNFFLFHKLEIKKKNCQLECSSTLWIFTVAVSKENDIFQIAKKPIRDGRLALPDLKNEFC
jgi:hypothetical protein